MLGAFRGLATRIAMPGRGLLLVLALLCLPSGCSRSQPPNVVLIVIDTLRADRLGVAGNAAGLTPFLDSLAQRGIFFRNAYAQSSWTNASVASLMTSRYQSQHGITSFRAVLAADELTLAEVLQQHGYATGGFIANFLLSKELGFAQGFDRYQTYSRTVDDGQGRPKFIKERAERINAEALSWLDEVRQQRPHAPLFLYLHYMEPHNPYDPPDANLDRVLDGRPRPDRAAVNARMGLPNVGFFADQMVQDVKAFYDAEVISIDAALSDLFHALAERHVLDNSVVVVVADHGEEFREHGLMGHHQTLYEEVLRVPLIVLLSAQSHGLVVDPIVSLTDVAPTVLDLVGVPSPGRFEGGSLRSLMDGSRAETPSGSKEASSRLPSVGVAFSELIKDGTQRQRPHERAVITAPTKLIADVDGEREFYDLHADAAETDPHALGEAERTRLTGQLDEFLAQTTKHA